MIEVIANKSIHYLIWALLTLAVNDINSSKELNIPCKIYFHECYYLLIDRDIIGRYKIVPIYDDDSIYLTKTFDNILRKKFSQQQIDDYLILSDYYDFLNLGFGCFDYDSKMDTARIDITLWRTNKILKFGLPHGDLIEFYPVYNTSSFVINDDIVINIENNSKNKSDPLNQISLSWIDLDILITIFHELGHYKSRLEPFISDDRCEAIADSLGREMIIKYYRRYQEMEMVKNIIKRR